MHSFIKGFNLVSVSAIDHYNFPEIMKHSGPASENDPKDTLGAETFGSFQRIFRKNEPDEPEEQAQLEEEPKVNVDYLQVIAELTQKHQKQESESYERGFQKGQAEGFSKGHGEGFSDGHDKGFAEGIKEIEPVQITLQQALKELQKHKEALYLKMEKEVVLLSLAIAKKIIVHEPTVNPDMVVHVVNNALESVALHAPLKLRVNPSEVAYIREHRDAIPVEGDITFIEDPSISQGGCLIESLSGDADARIEEQVQMLDELFAPSLEKIDLELSKLI